MHGDSIHRNRRQEADQATCTAIHLRDLLLLRLRTKALPIVANAHHVNAHPRQFLSISQHSASRSTTALGLPILVSASWSQPYRAFPWLLAPSSLPRRMGMTSRQSEPLIYSAEDQAVMTVLRRTRVVAPPPSLCLVWSRVRHGGN